MIVPKTHDLMHEVTISHEVMAWQAESRMMLAETPYTDSARPTLAANPAKRKTRPCCQWWWGGLA